MILVEFIAGGVLMTDPLNIIGLKKIKELNDKKSNMKLKQMFEWRGTMTDQKFIEEVFEIAFGDDAYNKGYYKDDVLGRLRNFSDATFEKELLEDRIAVLEKDLKFVNNNIKFILKHMEKYNG